MKKFYDFILFKLFVIVKFGSKLLLEYLENILVQRILSRSVVVYSSVEKGKLGERVRYNVGKG